MRSGKRRCHHWYFTLINPCFFPDGMRRLGEDDEVSPLVLHVTKTPVFCWDAERRSGMRRYPHRYSRLTKPLFRWGVEEGMRRMRRYPHWFFMFLNPYLDGMRRGGEGRGGRGGGCGHQQLGDHHQEGPALATARQDLFQVSHGNTDLSMANPTRRTSFEMLNS